jgi:hypothetical protein
MAVSFTGANGLFTRLGKVFQVADVTLTHQATLKTECEDAIDEYDKNEQVLISSLPDAILPAQISCASVFDTLRTIVQDSIIEMVDDDDPLSALTLTDAIKRLIDQMGTSDDLDGSTTAISAAAASGTGDGAAVVSPLTWDDKNNQYLRPESIVLTCTKDAQVSGTARRETFSVKGESKISDYKDPNWPGGSGIASSVRVIDPSENAQTAVGRNMLRNSDMEDFTVTNQLDNWSLTVGAWGTDVFEEGTTVFYGNKSLEIVGDGSTKPNLVQYLSGTGTTGAKLRPQTVYGISLRITADTGVVAGVLKVSVVSGAGTLGFFNIDLTATSDGGTWDHETHKFVTPAALGSAPFFQIETSTAITNTKKIWIDDLCMWRMSQHGGAGGPYIDVVAGATDFVIDDEIICTVTNDYAGEFQKHMDRFCDLYGKGLTIPFQTDASETIDDALIA